LKKKVTKNDTVQHFTGTPKKQNENDNGGGDQFYFNGNTKKSKSKKKEKRKKIVRPKLPKLDLNNYTFPKQIKPPSESWSKEQYDEQDTKIHQYLETKYKNDISKLKFFPEDIIIRFAISQRGMTPFSARKQETETHFKQYLKYHANYNYDDILTNDKLNGSKSISAIKEDIKALPLFIYGMDKEGHPIFWDDGSAYSKDAKLDIFKNDMKRVALFRSRLMKRMHNIKLASSEFYGKMIYKHCLVMDLDKFNAKKFVKDRKFHERNTKDISDLFPEVLHRLYIINAPWAFRSAWKVIQTFLHPITVEKTKILGKDYMDELQRDINLDMIPHKFGGIGPWDIVYGEAPFKYPLKTTDTKFDYNTLPKNTLPVPPRAAVPDMNKHKAKQMKQMKESGWNIDDLQIEEEEKKDYDDDDDDDEEEEDQQLQIDQAVSAPVTTTTTTTTSNNNNNNVNVGVGDQKDEE